MSLTAHDEYDLRRSTTRLDHHNTPMIDHIRELRSRDVTTYLSIGHKLGAGASKEILDLLGADFFASNAWITSNAFNAALRESEQLAADAWGSARSFYLVDGSSSGNHALMLATLGPGDKVIVSRDLHWSMLVALIITGAQPIYVSPRLDPRFDIGLGIDPDDVKQAIDRHPEAKLVAVVSPSFCGVSSDLKAICTIAHERDIPVYVDEAWGPHYHFHPDLPMSAMSSGADAAVSSVHKLLPAVSQGSVLHVQGNRIDIERLETSVHMMQTTSPLLPILASLDAARQQMALDGVCAMTRVIELARDVRSRINAIDGYDVIDHRSLGISETFLDVTKLVIDVHQLGMTGFAFEQRLNDEFAIAVELSDHRGIIGNLNLGDSPASVDRLVDALERIAVDVSYVPEGRTAGRSSGAAVAISEQAMTPRDAYFAPSRSVPIRESIGEVAAELVTPYPPGIPVLAPGDVITREKVEFLLETFELGRGNYGAGGSISHNVKIVERS